jgi:phosphohistidine phosphatase
LLTLVTPKWLGRNTNILDPMRLHILRHAKTNQRSQTGKDFDRALLPKGILQSKKISEHFDTIENIAFTWCSTAKRTRETLSFLNMERLGVITYKDDLYLASRDKIIEEIWELDEIGDLLIIGHNYGISDVASYYTDEHIELRTGEYICVEFEIDQWNESSRGLGTIVDRYRPSVQA